MSFHIGIKRVLVIGLPALGLRVMSFHIGIKPIFLSLNTVICNSIDSTIATTMPIAIPII